MPDKKKTKTNAVKQAGSSRSKYIKTSGVFEGIKIPREHRGKYVLINGGSVKDAADNPEDLKKVSVPSMVLYVP